MKTGRLVPSEDGPSPGLFATLVSSFLTQLRSEGYAERTLRKKRSVAASFARWSEGKQLGMDDLNESHLAAFVERSPRRHKARVNFELAALRPFLEYLRVKAGVSPPPLPITASPADEIEHRYKDYLRKERGLTENSLHVYLPFIHDFLTEQVEKTGSASPEKLDASTVRLTFRSLRMGNGSIFHCNEPSGL
jgi:site-specific recombinase XerD